MTNKTWFQVPAELLSKPGAQRVGTALFVASSAIETLNYFQKSDGNVAKATTQSVVHVGSMWGGAQAGAWMGGAAGTFLFGPGVGTAVGAGVGGVLGAVAGSEGGRWVANRVSGFF